MHRLIRHSLNIFLAFFMVCSVANAATNDCVEFGTGAAVDCVDSATGGDLVDDLTPQLGGDLDANDNTIYGSAASGGDLILGSTSHATKGNIQFGSAGSAFYAEDDNKLNMGNIILNAEDSRVEIGDPGTEGAGIPLNGATIKTGLRVNDFGGENPAQCVLHRHSSTLTPQLLGARALSDDSTHTSVTEGKCVLEMIGTGWTGSHYDEFGKIVICPDAGTINSTSSPGRIRFLVTPDSSDELVEAMRINNARKILIGSTDGTDEDIGLNADGSAKFNEQQNSVDFGIDGNTVENLFQVDGSDDDVEINGGLNANLPAGDNITIDGRTNPRTVTVGVMRWNHTPEATTQNTRALFLDVDANSVPNTQGMHIDLKATSIAAGETVTGIDIVGDTANSSGGVMRLLEFDKAGVGSAEVHAIHCNPEIEECFHHASGTFIDPTQGWDENGGFTDTTVAFGSSGTNVTIFDADNDAIYIGAEAAFQEVEVVLDTGASNPGIKPTFEIWTGASWTTITPVDNTAGFRESGIIDMEDVDLSSWVAVSVNSVSKFYLQITRTQNSLGTDPIENLIQTAATTDYIWDENGDVNIRALRIAGILSDNDDMVFEIDADNDGSNKYSFTDGASAEQMSLTEGGLLTVKALTATEAVILGDGGDNFSVASDGIDISTSGVITNGTIEGDGGVISTGEGGGTKFLREDGDGTSSWQTPAGGGSMSSWILEDGDGTEVTVQDANEVKFIESGIVDINWTDVDNCSDADPCDMTFTVTEADNLAAVLGRAADAADTAITSVAKLEGVDAQVYIDLGNDGTAEVEADTTVTLEAPNILLRVDSAAYLNIATADGGVTTISQVSDGADGIVIGDGGDTVVIASAGLDLDASGVITNATVDGDDNTIQDIAVSQTKLASGSRTTVNGDVVDADVETYIYIWRYGSFDPVATDDISQVDYLKYATTMLDFRCYSDQTTVVQLQRDDGSAANMFTANVSCDGDGGSACASGCDTTLVAAEDNFAATEKLGLVTVSVSGTPTVVTMVLSGTYDD